LDLDLVLRNSDMADKSKSKKISRRDFMGGAAAVAAFTIVPRHVLGGAGSRAASEKLNIAGYRRWAARAGGT